MKTKKNNFKGCLIGGAVGDALGSPIEFYHLSEIRDIHGYEGIKDYMEFNSNQGEFTDDTQMTLFTADALIRASNIDDQNSLNSIAHDSYLRWLHTQNYGYSAIQLMDEEADWLLHEPILYKRRAPGNTCISALLSGKAGNIQNPINHSKGCGGIMRVAPIGLFYGGESKRAFEIACDFSAITHGHPSGYLSAGFFAAVISDLCSGVNLLQSLYKTIEILKNWKDHEETLKAVFSAIELFEDLNNEQKSIDAEEIETLGQGWIAEEALSISLFSSLIFENDFKNGILFSVNHSGDSDSTGSITGNILGLINGVDAIPNNWKNNLIGYDIVETVAEKLLLKKIGE